MLFIVNPISGKGRKEDIINRLKTDGHKIVYTEYTGHGEMIAKEASEKIIVAIGGDGTVNEVAKGIMGSDKVLGIIPCGSGDGLALHLGISRNFEKALKTVLEGNIRTIDTASINGRPFFSVCGVGFDAVVSEQFARSGKRGLMNYIEQGIKTWTSYTPEKYKITIDEKTWENRAALITVGNSSQWGNNAKIAPLANISDGILDVTVVDMFNILDMPELAYLLMTGNLDCNSKVHCYRGRHISIKREVTGPAHADGDWFEAGTDIEISILPHSLNILVP